MNNALFEQAQQAYNNQDYAGALDYFNRVATDENLPLLRGEYGLVYHRIGNCFIKLQNYSDAISSYTNASSDSDYISVANVYYNLGMAYTYMHDFGNAIKNFEIAISMPNYNTKFKAYTAMGNALMKSGKSADAAASFRNAAMDERNPDPTRALLNLGVCFMALSRPSDAITVYKSAFRYNMKPDFKNRLNSNLGQAYVACGEMQDAVKAFEEALRDKTYKLSDSASVDYQRAIGAVSKGKGHVDVGSDGPAAATAAGMASGYAFSQPEQAYASVNPVSEAFDTTEEDAGSFYATDEDKQFNNWTNSTKDAAYNKQVKRNPAKIVISVILFFIAGCIIAGSVLFCFGFGIPSQEMVIGELFNNPIAAQDSVYDSHLTDNQKQNYSSMVCQDSNVEVKAVKRSVNESTAYVTADTESGSKVTYKIKMTRNFIGWKILDIELSFASSN